MVKVGDKLYVVYNSFKGYCEVTKVGRKYFYLEVSGRECGVCKETWNAKEDVPWSSRFRVFENEEQYLMESGVGKLADAISSYVRSDWGQNLKSLPLEKLQKIAEILGIEI